MKNCKCEYWERTIGTWDNNSSTFNSSTSSTPTYFGREIIYCPWCGNSLESDCCPKPKKEGWWSRYLKRLIKITDGKPPKCH